MSLTRRSLLGVAAGVVLAGCRPHHRRSTLPPVADTAALAAALSAEQTLLASYDRAIATTDAVAAGRLSVARQRHAEHVQALQARLPTPSPPVPSAAATTTSLATALRASSLQLQSAAVSARAGQTAALLASIAAEHAADAETTSARS